VICVAVRYKLKLKWMKSRKIVTEKYTLFNSKEKVYIFIEIVLIALMPYPFFEGFTFPLEIIKEISFRFSHGVI